jgi:hypothetical protein
MHKVLRHALLGLALTSCAGVNHKVALEGAGVPASFVVDRTGPDDYPSFLAAEGNVYSCRYGIHHVSRGDFSTPKAEAFGGLLVRYVPDIVKHQVVLERFDVYYNRRLKMLHNAGMATGGIAGNIMEDASRQNAKVFTFKDLVVDPAPLLPKPPNVHLVGCDDAHEGEYDAAAISGGSDVIVTWVRFSVDGMPYHVRSFLQFQPESPEEVDKAIARAIDGTVQALSPAIAKGQPFETADAPAPQTGVAIAAAARPAPSPPVVLASTGPLKFELASAGVTALGGELRDTLYSEKRGDAVISQRTFADGVVTYAGQVGLGKGSKWAGLGFSLDLLPTGAGVDARRFKTVTFRLAATTRSLRLRLVGPEEPVRSAGCYPRTFLDVTPDVKEYTIPLSRFDPEPWCAKQGRDVRETLPVLTGFEIVSQNIDQKPITLSVGATVLNP